jgi:hypothetical protein
VTIIRQACALCATKTWQVHDKILQSPHDQIVWTTVRTTVILFSKYSSWILVHQVVTLERNARSLPGMASTSLLTTNTPTLMQNWDLVEDCLKFHILYLFYKQPCQLFLSAQRGYLSVTSATSMLGTANSVVNGRCRTMFLVEFPLYTLARFSHLQLISK